MNRRSLPRQENTSPANFSFADEAPSCSILFLMSAVPVRTALAAMRTAAFAHACAALPMTMCVSVTLAMMASAVSVAAARAMRMSFAVVMTTVTFTVTMSLASVRMGTAMLTLCMVMMRTVRLRRICERARQMLRDSLIRCTLDACTDANARLAERLDRARADAAADQHIDLMRLQKFRKRTVTAALCADDLRPLDRMVLDIVELECLRMTEVLKHRAIFIFIGDCNSHCIFSFPAGG